MRPIWKGHISFGLVSVPVTLYPAEQRTDLQLHMLDSRNMSRVRYDRVNADTGEEVPWNQIVRGYEYADGNYVLVSDEELERAAPEVTKAVEIDSFVDVEQIDPMYFDKPYFLEPAKSGEKGYVLLRDVLQASRKVGIARVVIRTRQYIAAMAPRGDVLVLNLLRYKMELRSPSALTLPGSADDVGISKAEMKMAQTLVDSMTREWNPADYHDEYREQLMAWIQKRIDEGNLRQAPDLPDIEDEPPAPINMMEALKRSLAHKGAAHAATGDDEEAPRTARKAGTPRLARDDDEPPAARSAKKKSTSRKSTRAKPADAPAHSRKTQRRKSG
jgi:DNA end-binding protein Ku